MNAHLLTHMLTHTAETVGGTVAGHVPGWGIGLSKYLFRVWGNSYPLALSSRGPKKLPHCRDKKHFLLIFLDRSSRPGSGILLDGSEEERKAGMRDLKF